MTGEPGRRILHAFAPAPFGGAEVVVRSLAVCQQAAGHDVAVAAVLDPDTSEHPVVLDLESHNIEVHELRPPARAYLKERRAIGELCRAIDPDVVHTHGYRADVLHGGPARKLGIATVSTVHGFTGGDWKNRIYEALQRRAYRSYDAVVAVSAPLKAELAQRGVPEDRLFMVRNAWLADTAPLDRAEARHRLGIGAPGGPLVGYVGRVGREKGADIFIESLALLNDPWNAVVIGDGRLKQELLARTEALGIADRVRWTGFIPDARRSMTALDVFVLSSRTEGTPIALFEAMSARVPVVATRVGGVPDVVSDAEAVLVPPEQPNALAAAIANVLEDPAAARERAVRARKRLETDFGPEAWVDAYERVYDEAVSRAPGRSAR